MSGHFDTPTGDDDESPAGAFPPSPQPPHERAWRHPSELGFAAHTRRVEEPRDIGRTGRGLLAFSLVAGGLLLLGLVVIVQPRTSETDAVGVLRLTSDAVEVVEIDARTGDDTMGMYLGTTYLVTTVAAVEGFDGAPVVTRDARTGDEHLAEVIHVDPDLHLAILSITDGTTGPNVDIGTLPVSIDLATSANHVIVVDRGGRVFLLGERTDDGLMLLSSRGSSNGGLTEGAPVVDQWGSLIGLYTGENDTPCVVPLTDIESLLEQLVAN